MNNCCPRLRRRHRLAFATLRQNGLTQHRFCRNKSGAGFTLMEIIIVVCIILMLTALGVESYAVARRSMMIDLTTDKLVETLHSSRERAKNSATCTGMRFEKNKMPKNIQAPYKNPVDGCSPDFEVSEAVWPKETEVYALLLDADQKDAFDIVFVPPLGQIVLPDNYKNAEIILSLKNQKSSRKITLSALTGKIEKPRRSEAKAD